MDDWTLILITASVVVGGFLTWYLLCAIQARRSVPPLVFQGKHCYITGGSAGLGEQLAILLAEAGAHVTIVARNPERLAKVQAQVETHRAYPDQQRIMVVSADVGNPQNCAEALQEATRKQGGVAPEYVFSCAGLSTPRLFLDYAPEEFEQTMAINYFGTVHTFQEAAKLMIKQDIRGRLVAVSSQAGLVGLPGYAEYAPTKAALRMLCETLYYELSIYGITTHCFLPANIRTPGFDREMETKPRITRIMDGDDEAIDPRTCAQHMLSGMAKGYPMIVSDPLSDLVRAVCKGLSPANNMALDTVYIAVGWFVAPLWRAITWWQAREFVKLEAQQRRQQLRS
ncbi:3-dehydrosphinganine reductase [Dispira simplex]|nr:3-dehydrosphinganine reductase [Dispira simplex]